MAVYFDNAATTRITKPVLDAMLPFLSDIYGNPSSIHSFGRKARRHIDRARLTVANVLNADCDEIYFTSGGTESDNWAVTGAAKASEKKHIITSSIEHPALLNTCRSLEKEGFRVTFLPVDSCGRVLPETLENALDDDTCIVSIMTANNETGTIQDIPTLCRIAHDHGALFHTDAVQAAGTLKLDVKALDCDMLSISGHKFHAPKGVGALYIRQGVHIERFMNGGEQERYQRAGTENIASIIGMAAALKLAYTNIDAHCAHLSSLRSRMENALKARLSGITINAEAADRLPGHSSISVDGVQGEPLLLNLDLKGFAVSSGSACTAGSTQTSHVLLALGIPEERAQGSIRVTLGDDNTEDEVDAFVDALCSITEKLRSIAKG